MILRRIKLLGRTDKVLLNEPAMAAMKALAARGFFLATSIKELISATMSSIVMRWRPWNVARWK